MSNSANRSRNSMLAVNLGLTANIFLALAKTIVGLLGRSQALLADGINSTSDVAYYVVVSIFMRQATKPADNEHPYGHSQLESIASLVVGAFIMTTGITIFWDSVTDIFARYNGTGQAGTAAPITLVVALLTVGTKLFLFFYTRVLARRTNNPAVLALTYDHRNDILSASGTVVGIFLSLRGYPWVDPLVGALVALLVLRTGVEIVRQSSADLMDDVPSEELAGQIDLLLKGIPEVLQLEEMHAHRFGPYFVVNLTIGVNGSLSIVEGDAIACRVEQSLYDSIDLLRRVYVHYHPAIETVDAISTTCEEERLPTGEPAD
jgi:cation diffusion facilitator family transporter